MTLIRAENFGMGGSTGVEEKPCVSKLLYNKKPYLLGCWRINLESGPVPDQLKLFLA